MNAIELMMALFLNASIMCHALPADVQQIGGRDYQILSFACGEYLFQIWQRRCEPGNYWTRPFLLKELSTDRGFYLNQFAELYSGEHVSLDEVYVQPCGT